MKHCIVFGCLLTLLFSGCASHGPAFLGNTAGYLAKPVYNGEHAGGMYLSGRYNQGHTYFPDEKNRSFDLGFHTAFLWRYFYLAGGIYGYGGKYHIQKDSAFIVSLTPYGYFGFGGRFQIGGRMELSPKTDLLFGVSEELFSQSGAYERETEDVYDDVLTLGIEGFSLGLNVEMRYAFTAQKNIGVGYTFDSILGDLEDPPARYQNLRYTHRFSLSTNLDRMTIFSQLGFTSTGQSLFSIGLAAGFPYWQKK